MITLGLTIQAWLELLYADIVGLMGFHALHSLVCHTRLTKGLNQTSIIRSVVAAIDSASVAYFKPAQCLQRSVAVTRLLRRHGVSAQLVIGYHIPPLKAHAWVEVSGEVVNDDRVDLKYFTIIDRW